MNAIEAWNKARGGDTIKARSYMDAVWIKKNDRASDDLHNFLKYAMSEFKVTADWEIERKPLAWEGEVIWRKKIPSGNIVPDMNNCSFMGSCEFDGLLGKRTRIRIEEIIE